MPIGRVQASRTGRVRGQAEPTYLTLRRISITWRTRHRPPTPWTATMPIDARQHRRVAALPCTFHDTLHTAERRAPNSSWPRSPSKPQTPPRPRTPWSDSSSAIRSRPGSDVIHSVGRPRQSGTRGCLRRVKSGTQWCRALSLEGATLARHRYPTDLSDDEWALVAPLIPAPKPRGRPLAHPRREIVNALAYWARSGCAWRMLPRVRVTISRARGGGRWWSTIPAVPAWQEPQPLIRRCKVGDDLADFIEALLAECAPLGRI